jgi:dihydrofolate reductase
MNRPSELLLGRKTFEIFASYWPTHAAGWPGINEMKKYVVSKTLTNSEWNNSVVIKNVEDIKKIKEETGPDLYVHGSGNLIQSLLKNDFVDELWLKIFPVLLGSGKKLFAEGTMPGTFELLETKTSPSGVIFANYKRAGEVKTGSF